MALCTETDPRSAFTRVFEVRQDVERATTTTIGRALGDLVADAVMHHRAGRLAEAEAAYLAVLRAAPGHPGALHNLGVVAAARGETQAAIGHFDAAIAAEPDYAAGHYNRAVACHALGRTGDAILGFRRVCTIDPGHYDAHRALGFLWLAQRERDRALDHFARTYELRRGDDWTGIAAKSLSHATRGKLLHDAGQFDYLAARRRDGRHLAILAREYKQVANEIGPGATALSARQLESLGEDYNTGIHISAAPACAGSAVAERRDRDAIVRAFKAEGGRPGTAGATWFDDLLTPEALNRLNRFLVESTVWHDFSHIGGFVASYLEDGLASPLLLQIADELRSAFPEILAPHPLSQAWAFKGLDGDAAIGAHADDGAISVNFWVTPDVANLRPGSGGLSVCRVPPPADWTLSGYDADKSQVAAFMARHAGDTLTVPYRENRAALFQSRLFHRSDAPHFASGHENRRVNVTLLFGRREERGIPHAA
jgi:tetratricopeptide (TPR) repeat protein